MCRSKEEGGRRCEGHSPANRRAGRAAVRLYGTNNPQTRALVESLPPEFVHGTIDERARIVATTTDERVMQLATEDPKPAVVGALTANRIHDYLHKDVTEDLRMRKEAAVRGVPLATIEEEERAADAKVTAGLRNTMDTSEPKGTPSENGGFFTEHAKAERQEVVSAKFRKEMTAQHKLADAKRKAFVEKRAAAAIGKVVDDKRAKEAVAEKKLPKAEYEALMKKRVDDAYAKSAEYKAADKKRADAADARVAARKAAHKAKVEAWKEGVAEKKLAEAEREALRQDRSVAAGLLH